VVSTAMSALHTGTFHSWWHSSYQPLLQHSLSPVTGDSVYNLQSVSIPTQVPFHTLYQWQWKYRDVHHINQLELYSVLSAIKWMLSHPHTMGVRALLLTDNQAVYYGIRKGRSSSPSMLLLLRKLNSLLLASGITLHVAWVATAVNPADYSSRHFPSSPLILSL
jgi:hypothetical protein